MNLNYYEIFVTIATDKIEDVVYFYSQLLGQKPTVSRPQVYAEFKLEKLRIAIFKPKAKNHQEFSNHGSSLSFCLEVENLEEAIARMIDLGCTPPGEIITASHGREIYGYDPAGNRLILHQSH